jgi:hypothetical protein
MPVEDQRVSGFSWAKVEEMKNEKLKIKNEGINNFREIRKNLRRLTFIPPLPR